MMVPLGRRCSGRTGTPWHTGYRRALRVPGGRVEYFSRNTPVRTLEVGGGPGASVRTGATAAASAYPGLAAEGRSPGRVAQTPRVGRGGTGRARPGNRPAHAHAAPGSRTVGAPRLAGASPYSAPWCGTHASSHRCRDTGRGASPYFANPVRPETGTPTSSDSLGPSFLVPDGPQVRCRLPRRLDSRDHDSKAGASLPSQARSGSNPSRIRRTGRRKVHNHKIQGTQLDVSTGSGRRTRPAGIAARRPPHGSTAGHSLGGSPGAHRDPGGLRTGRGRPFSRPCGCSKNGTAGEAQGSYRDFLGRHESPWRCKPWLARVTSTP